MRPKSMEIAAGERRRLKLVLFSLFLTVVAALVFYGCCLDRTFAAMYRGESLSFLNHLIHNTGDTPLSYYVARGRNLFSYLILLDVVAHLILAVLLAHDFMRRIFVNFFTTPTSPLNLAIFRVAVFVGVLSQIHPWETQWFGKVPHGLQMAPFGVGWLLPHLPITQSSMTIAITLLIIFCVTGLIGFFARTSAVLALIASFYVLGVPEFYGTVEHYHHLLWFLAILAVSRSGDALSIDAFLRNSRRVSEKPATPPQPSVIYSLPLRFACLLLGAIYFFPGAWKIRICGFDWALSDNLKYQMYARWMDLDGWTPFFRLDLHPWLYRSIALGTLAFELSFIFVVFFPRLRIVLAMVGIGFHFGSGLFMRIPFFDLWICYVVLFDVSGWLATLRQKFFSDGSTVGKPSYNNFDENGYRKIDGDNAKSMRWAPVALAGTLLLVGCCYCGSLGIVRGWPFACYPRFAWNPGSEVESIELSALAPGGEVVFQGTPDLRQILKH
ncbi:MAG: HTTM domain-containing protein, partial [Candidatus Acidiferrum sp.]